MAIKNQGSVSINGSVQQNGENATSLGTVCAGNMRRVHRVLTLLREQVQYVYLAMSCLGIVVNIAFFFAKLPEVAQVVAVDTQDVVSVKGFFKKYHTIAGFFAEFAYVSAMC